MNPMLTNLKTPLLALTLAVLVGCGGAEERKSVYMDKAKQSYELGDYDKARIELKNVLQIDPKDAEAHYQIARVFEKLQNYRKAFGHYLRVEELDSEHLLNQAALGKLYLLVTNEQDKAQEKIDWILAKDPQNPDGLLLTAAQAHRGGDIVKAREIAEQILVNDPAHTDTVVFLSTIYVSQKNFASAVSVLEAAVKSDANNEQLNKLYALSLMRNNQHEEAEQAYKAFIDRNPDSAEGYNYLAAFYNETNNVDMAESMLQKSIEADTSDPDRVLTYIKYIKTVRGDDVAIEKLEEYTRTISGEGKLRIALGELYVITNQLDKAREAYTSAISDFSEEVTGVEARISLAAIELTRGEVDDARGIINEALQISPNDAKVNLIRAKIALHDKDIEQAILSLRVVTKETPENIEAQILLAKAYEAEGNEEQKLTTLYRAYESNRMNADGLMELAKYQMDKDVVQTERIIDDYLAHRPDDYDGLSIKAAILNQNKSYQQAGEIAEKLLELYPDKPNGYLQSTPWLTSDNQVDKAIEVLEKGYINAEENRKILILLSTLQVGKQKFDVVQKRLEAEIKNSPDDGELYGLLAKVHLAKGDIDATRDTLQKAIARDSRLEEAYLMLSDVYINSDRKGEVETVLKSGMTNLPDSVKLPLKLATFYEIVSDHDAAISIYRDMMEKHSNNVIVVNNLAALLADHGSAEDLTLAKSLADKLSAIKQPVFQDTVAWVYYKTGDYARAVEILEQVVQQAPGVSIFNYHLGMAYKMTGDTSSAKASLEKSLANDAPFKEREAAEAALKEL